MSASYRAGIVPLAASLALAGLWAWAGQAHASPSYPRVMDRALSLGCQPACALCHLNGETGPGTTNTPFGIKLRRETRLTCCKDPALEEALQLFDEMGFDSDGDGVSDIDELRAGTDPNGDGALSCDRPQLGDGSRIFGQGCSAAPPRAPRPDGSGDDAMASLLTVALVGLVVRLRTRGRRPRR